MQEHDQHVSPIKNPKQLIVVVFLAFLVPISVAVLISQWVTSGTRGVHENQEAIVKRIEPVGEVVVAAPSGPKGQMTGEQVYGQVCKACHESGALGSPKFGDKAAWAPHLMHGIADLYHSALNGKGAMPPKGGNASLSEAQVKAGVDYMVNAAK